MGSLPREAGLPDTETLPSGGGRLSLGDFKLERVVFEVRYPHAVLFWDRAGALWNEASRLWPGLNLMHAEPAKTAFRIGDEFHVAMELEATRLVSFWPEKGLERFQEMSKTLVELISGVLEIKSFSRVGLRTFYFMEFPDRDSATAALISAGLTRVPPGRHFGTEGAPTSFECCYRWEVKAIGVRVWVGYQFREYKFEKPPEIKVPKLEKGLETLQYHGILFDIDFYTTAPVEVGQLGVHDWIQQHLHELRRDADSFLGG